MKTKTPCTLCGSTKPHECIGFAPAVETNKESGVTVEDQVEELKEIPYLHWENCPTISTEDGSDERLCCSNFEAIEQALLTAEKRVREEIKKEITEQTLLNDGDDTFVKLGEALWVCDCKEDRKKFFEALTDDNTKD